MMELINDKTTYLKLDVDPTQKFIQQTNRWMVQKEIHR